MIESYSANMYFNDVFFFYTERCQHSRLYKQWKHTYKFLTRNKPSSTDTSWLYNLSLWNNSILLSLLYEKRKQYDVQVHTTREKKCFYILSSVFQRQSKMFWITWLYNSYSSQNSIVNIISVTVILKYVYQNIKFANILKIILINYRPYQKTIFRRSLFCYTRHLMLVHPK
jgi:hypothetical protein